MQSSIFEALLVKHQRGQEIETHNNCKSIKQCLQHITTVNQSNNAFNNFISIHLYQLHFFDVFFLHILSESEKYNILTSKVMDIFDVFSSEEEVHEASIGSDGRETISTDAQKSNNTNKTKPIKKKFEPLFEDGQVFRYEEDPSEYRRIRKYLSVSLRKIQNRESATRTRGRKKNAYENLEQEVEHLRKSNSELLLRNAKLESQNKTLNDQMGFLKSLVRPVSVQNDPVEKYLAPEVGGDLFSGNVVDSESMQDESPLFRIPTGSGNSSSWFTIAVFTLVLAIFVLPSDPSASNPVIIAQQTDSKYAQPQGATLMEMMVMVCVSGKILLKYIFILGYIWLLFSFLHRTYGKEKLKKV